jgi:hypothetical protein
MENDGNSGFDLEYAGELTEDQTDDLKKDSGRQSHCDCESGDLDKEI